MRPTLNFGLARTIKGQSNPAYYKQWRQTKRGKFKDYKANAKHRGHTFSLTFEQFCSFWQQPCWYCNDEILTIGLDRVDNSRGYVLDNVIACCRPCNEWKRAMAREQFLARCRRVVRKHGWE